VLVDDQLMLSFSQQYSCSDSNFTIPELEPRLFSFNTPIGACPYCNGLGLKLEVSKDLIVDSSKSLNDGGIVPYKNNDPENLNNSMLEELCKIYKIDMHDRFF
jgi:excinuclease ABC subunit A